MLTDWIDLIREDGKDEGVWHLDVVRVPQGIPPLVVGLARVQSYRGRTTAALIQEIEDYVEEAGLSKFRWKVIGDQVLIW